MEGNPFSGTAAGKLAILQPSKRGGLLPSRLATAAPDLFLAEAQAEFQHLITQAEFPCVGARAALNSESYALAVYDQLGGANTTASLAQDLYEFTQSELRRESEYATFVAVFRAPASSDETQFEEAMWRQLTELHRTDAKHFDYDPSVRSDPSDPKFSFSFAGQSLYVIGMHPHSSRLARRFRWPAMIFNPHEQFERLRTEGKWQRMQQTIRERDLHLQGSINPMLSDFGESSEARQYSGRAVPTGWQAPFEAIKRVASGKCPFAH